MGYASIKLLAESTNETKHKDIAILKKIEIIYVSISLAIALLVALSSKIIATKWLEVDDLSIETESVIKLMSALILVTWPQSLYQSFLVGQQRFMAKNFCLILSSVVISASMFLGIKYYDFDINHYFLVMIICMILQTIYLRHVAWSKLDKRNKFKTNSKDLRSFFSYASGVSLFSICSLIFFQGPVVALSSLSKTSELGIYNLSMTFPFALLSMMYPIGSVFFPKLVKVKDNKEARVAFHYGTTLLVAFVMLGTATVIINIDWIFSIWLGHELISEQMHKITKHLTLAILCYGTSMSVSNLLLSNGNSKQLFYAYMLALIYLAINIFGNFTTISAMYISKIWMNTAFILMTLIIFFGFLKYSFLFKKWFFCITKALIPVACALLLFIFIYNSLPSITNYRFFLWSFICIVIYIPLLLFASKYYKN